MFIDADAERVRLACERDGPPEAQIELPSPPAMVGDFMMDDAGFGGKDALPRVQKTTTKKYKKLIQKLMLIILVGGVCSRNVSDSAAVAHNVLPCTPNLEVCEASEKMRLIHRSTKDLGISVAT